MPVSEETYERVALEDPDGKWELHCGELRSKPGMTTTHNQIGRVLGFRLQQQLPLEAFVVSVDTACVRISPTRSYIPDVAVIPAALVERMEREQPTRLEAYTDPLPLIVKVWSPSRGRADLTEKLPASQERGDAEIWLIHPRQRTLSAWVRQPDGTFTEHVYREGVIRPVALPNVSIDLTELFR